MRLSTTDYYSSQTGNLCCNLLKMCLGAMNFSGSSKMAVIQKWNVLTIHSKLCPPIVCASILAPVSVCIHCSASLQGNLGFLSDVTDIPTATPDFRDIRGCPWYSLCASLLQSHALSVPRTNLELYNHSQSHLSQDIPGSP